MSAHSIHHVTAVTAHIANNLRFYTEVLGLRLVKKSVNHDDVRAYHLFYADAVGSPGNDMTFFDWPAIGANTPGLASIASTRFRVPGDALDFWFDRLSGAGSAPMRAGDHADRSLIQFSDPEGQRLELVDDHGWPSLSQPWDGAVPADKALRGILGVDLASARPDSTRRVLTDILEFEETSPNVFEALSDDAHAQVRLDQGTFNRIGRLGGGGVHHVAFRVTDDDELNRMQAKVEAAGLQTSGYVDRFYFHSLYFREPGGVLFELATDGPGFASDEDREHLGEALALPPFLEPRRKEIEAGLKPLP